jgi:hypothetical protein
MEDVVKMSTLWQLKLVRDITDALENLKRAIEFWTQFPLASDIK